MWASTTWLIEYIMHLNQNTKRSSKRWKEETKEHAYDTLAQ
jgi:hypothetical protein